MSLLKSVLNSSMGMSNNPISLVQQKIGGNPQLMQLFQMAKSVRNPKQAVADLISKNNYTDEQIMQIKQMAKTFGVSDADLSQLDEMFKK